MFIFFLTFLPNCTRQQSDADKNLKVLHQSVVASIKTLDPADSSDLYSNMIIHMIYEPLFQYAYLKRPLTLEPDLAKAMPKVSKDGLVYDIELKPGVYFTDDPAFKATQGKGRELKAEDIVYSIKRLADAKTRSTGWWLFDGRLQGLNAFHAASEKSPVTDYTMPVAGLLATGPYSLRLLLTAPYPQLLYVLAMPYSAAVAREVVEYYASEFINHPVGTGPFLLEHFNRDLEVVLKRNPHYREAFYPNEGEVSDAAQGLLSAAGQRLPFLDKVVVHVFRESPPRWLNFLQGNLDAADIPKDNFESAMDANGELKAELKNKGIQLKKQPELDVTFTAFNMQDPLLGKNVELRRAMSLATDRQRFIELFYNGRAIPAESPIPPGLSGYDANFKNPYEGPNIERAKEYLKRAGYPEGKGLPEIVMESITGTTQRQGDELLMNDMAKIGIRVKVNSNTWPQLLEKIKKQQAPIFSLAWGADYPDAENFLSLFYGPNASPGNNQFNYKNPAYDRLYEQARVMADSPARSALYQQMARLVVEDVPCILGAHRIGYAVHHGWLRNYKPHPLRHGFVKYYDIDLVQETTLKAKLH